MKLYYYDCKDEYSLTYEYKFSNAKAPCFVNQFNEEGVPVFNEYIMRTENVWFPKVRVYE